ncbi:KpsF/GutQ family sugar-phosphate isomerase [Henriciella aquimarina]|uniref:KpsF/GutQ family sugar-phosphate isomerase n=1 Tax=Henriciella aquimarina TaxID=545261 RepID=UPI000A04ED14|nr:KpsF/GutQ family sugar-phosphate isomerase [Henriciella aquimarina]
MTAETILASGQRVIRTEIEALDLLEQSLGPAFVAAVEAIVACQGRIILAGVGKSGHVARKISATLASTGTPSLYIHPTEASHGDLGMVTQGDILIALSRSGETKELDDLVTYTRRFAIPLIALTADETSALGRASDICLTIPDAPEACAETRAPTTSTTLTMALGDALAVAVLEQRGFTGDDFKIFHPGGKLGAMLRTVGDLMHAGAEMPAVQTGTQMPDALAVMADKGFGCLAVTEPQGSLIGIVTDGDIRRLVARGRMAMVIDEGMTRDPVTISPAMLASSALALMNEKRITQLIVTEAGKPVGVVHMHDFLKAGVA